MSENARGKTNAPAPPARPVSSAGKYHMLMELGRGGMAVVYAAMARGMGGFSKLVVLKKAREEFGDRPEAVGMFLNEARLSARMNHPNVVQVYEVFEDQGLPVIVMEYLAGQPFATVLRRAFNDPSYSMNLALSVLCRSLEGLHYAHTLTDFSGRPLKLIHRDVTPHNVMVTYDGQVKLLDFGIAKLDAGAAETKTGVIKGKLGYMPREQVDGSELDVRADVFAIGVMIWEAAARQRMWGTLSDPTVIKHLLCDEIPALRQANPDVDPELEAICNKATAPNREHRYSDAHELLVALRGYLKTRGGVARESAIAAWVNRTCADLKAESQRRMDRELATFSEGGGGSWTKPKSELTGSRPQAEASDLASAPRRPQADTGTGAGYAGHTETETEMARPRRWPLVAGGAAVAVALLIAWQGLLRSAAPEVPASAAAAASPSVVPVADPAPRETVEVSFRAEPAGAVLYLDGERLAANPFAGALPPDQREHELRVEAEGFQTLTRKVRLDADANVAVTLTATPAEAGEAEELAESADDDEPSGATSRSRARTRKSARAKAASRTPAAAKPASAVAPPPVAEPSNNCDPPYLVDDSGIKRYKRGCFGK